MSLLWSGREGLWIKALSFRRHPERGEPSSAFRRVAALKRTTSKRLPPRPGGECPRAREPAVPRALGEAPGKRPEPRHQIPPLPTTPSRPTSQRVTGQELEDKVSGCKEAAGQRRASERKNKRKRKAADGK